MPRTLTARWTLRAVIVLALVLALQSALAHVIALAGAADGPVALVVGGIVALVSSTLVIRKPIRSFCTTHDEMLASVQELTRVRGALSRRAGMAELAIGVLHDVGNALDGVTAGVGLASERLATMRLEPLDRLAKLLADHRHDLPAFVAPGAAGHDVPEFVQELAIALREDQTRIADELGSLRTTAEHACGIVRARQLHAKPVQVAESCDIDELIDDALRTASVPASIEVARAGAGVIASVDRQRVVQILVNLVGNAVDAVGARASGRIAIDVIDLGARFEILVTDNGTGISADDRERVFQVGFTTKRAGHGLGLHAGSSSAVEMGGRLELRHTEVGRGCRFALSLPKQCERAAA
jgi:signal transduction histidine kinase